MLFMPAEDGHMPDAVTVFVSGRFLGIYLTCTMAITTLSMVLTVFVLNLHHISDRPVPSWAKKVVLVYMARLMGMCQAFPQKNEHHRNKNSRLRQPFTSGVSFFRRSYTGVHGEGEESSSIIELQNRAMAARNAVSDSSKFGSSNHVPSSPGRTSTHAFGNDLHAEKEAKNGLFVGEKDSKEDKAPDYSKDWSRMAEVFDRLFFWLFLLAIVITTLVLFHPLTRSVFRENASQLFVPEN